MGQPPPVPSFRLLQDLSVEELKNICIRHRDSTTNLSKSRPSFKSHRTINTPNASLGDMSHVSFLPGGDAMMLLYEHGGLEIWAIGVDNPARLIFLPEDVKDNDMARNPHILETRVSNPILDLETERKTGSTINLLLTRRHPWRRTRPSTPLLVVQLHISLEAMAVNFNIWRSHTVPVPDDARFNIRKGVVTGVYNDRNSQLAHIFIMTYGEAISAIINTGLPSDWRSDLDVQLINDTDLLLFIHGDISLSVYAYLDFRQLLSDCGPALKTIVPRPLKPQSQKVFKIESPGPAVKGDHPSPMNLQNVPNTCAPGLTPVFSKAYSVSAHDIYRNWLRLLSLDLQQMLQLLKDRDGEDIVLSRSLGYTGRLGDEDEPPLALGSLGRTVVWAKDEPDDKTSSGIRKVRLLPVADFMTKTSDGRKSKLLEVPVNQDDGLPWLLAFCDERTILAVVNNPGYEEEQEVHLFQY